MKRILAIWLPNWPMQSLTGTRREPEPPEDHDPAVARIALEKLAQWCESFSPTVGLEEADEPDTLLLDVTGLTDLFGGEDAFVRRVANDFQQRHLAVRMGLADTIGAAWAIAHFGLRIGDCGLRMEDDSSSKSAIRNPQSAMITPSGEGSNALKPLPIEALRLPGETIATLHQLGIERIGHLLSLPRESLSSRFGPLILKRLDQATGISPEIINPVQPPLDLTAQWSLEYSTDRREILQQILEHLIRRVTTRLVQHDEGVLHLSCQFTCHTAQVSCEVGLFQPSADPQHLIQLVHTTFERTRLIGPVTKVQVRITRYAPLECWQRELFDDGCWRLSSREFASLVDRLAVRLGRKSIVRPRLHSDAQPEMACREQPLVGGRKRAERKKRRTEEGGQKSERGPLDRPVHLMNKPLPIEVIAVTPEGSPVRFWFGGQEHQVARHWGPERIETGWWRKQSVRRDYYRVETESGQRFWLFRQLHAGDWFLHGIFS